MIDSVSVDLPDEDQQLSETERTLQYGVDLSLYPLNITLNFKVRTKKIYKLTQNIRALTCIYKKQKKFVDFLMVIINKILKSVPVKTQ